MHASRNRLQRDCFVRNRRNGNHTRVDIRKHFVGARKSTDVQLVCDFTKALRVGIVDPGHARTIDFAQNTRVMIAKTANANNANANVIHCVRP